MAPHSSALAWKIPWTEEPGGLQSMWSLRDGHDWASSLSLFTFMHWRRKWQPTPVFLPGESQDGGAWWAALYGVAQSWRRLKRLSSSSKMHYKYSSIYFRISVNKALSKILDLSALSILTLIQIPASKMICLSLNIGREKNIYIKSFIAY